MNLKLEHINKSFKHKTVLKDINIEFQEKKLHIIQGQNGAGKSTLAKIISGAVQASGGKIFVDGKELIEKKEILSFQKQIAMVLQIPLLAENISVKENILVSSPDFFFNKARIENILSILKKFNQKINLKSKIKDLTNDKKFFLSLAIALEKNPKILILDEPSTFLNSQEKDILYKELKSLCKENLNIIIISHSISEAEKYADTVTIIEDGNILNQKIEFSAESNSLRFSKNQKEDLCFKIENLFLQSKKHTILNNVNLVCNYGQITTISGIQESEIINLEDFICGLNQSKAKGIISFINKSEHKTTRINLERKKFNSSFLRKNKTAIVPSNRTFRASDPKLTIEEMLNVYNKKNNTKNYAENLIKKAKINIGLEETASNLSGGMCQRLILARELSENPDFIIMCNPMQGLDINSQKELISTIIELQEKNKSILIIGAKDFPLSLSSKVYSLENSTLKEIYSEGNIQQ